MLCIVKISWTKDNDTKDIYRKKKNQNTDIPPKKCVGHPVRRLRPTDIPPKRTVGTL